MPQARSIAIHACAAVLLLVSHSALSDSTSAQAQLNAPIPDPAVQWNEQGFDRGKLFDAVVEAIAQKLYDHDKLKQLDWPTRAKAARASVIGAATIEDAR